MTPVWRLLSDPPAEGAWNMAVDEAILEAVEKKQSPPTLRLYAWKPACLSLGRSQPVAEADLPALQSRGWQIVRRPTGGRAILHTDELTYALIAPADNPLVAGGVLESYQRIAQALIRTLTQLQVPVEIAQAHKPDKNAPPVCFEVPSSYEITVNGKKLIGSAQARRPEAVLQHGSLPLYGDLTRITLTLAFANEETRQQAAQRLQQKATTLEAALGRRVSWQTAAESLISAFAQSFDLSFEAGQLTPAETQRARALVQEKYANPAWTQHR